MGLVNWSNQAVGADGLGKALLSTRKMLPRLKLAGTVHSTTTVCGPVALAVMKNSVAVSVVSVVVVCSVVLVSVVFSSVLLVFSSVGPLNSAQPAPSKTIVPSAAPSASSFFCISSDCIKINKYEYYSHFSFFGKCGQASVH